MSKAAKAAIYFTSSLIFFTNAIELGINETCESAGYINHFDWDDLTSNITHKPSMNYSLDIDINTLELVVIVDLEYIGFSYADDHTPGFGVTYVLDFEDYNAESDDIREPGNCQNRFDTDFISPSFNQLWTYSDTPYIDNHLGNESYLSYPPSGEYWDLSIDTVDDICTPVRYEGRFSWSELRGCSSYDGLTEYTVINTDENWLNLSGVFYINLVSPLARNSDLGYYRVYQMLSAPFTIALRNQINIISSVGINLFTITIIAVYKEDLETDFRLIVLTESADFLMLTSPFLLDSPTLNPDTINFNLLSESLNEGCLTASSNICSQLWEIYADEVSCPPTNFTGNYGLQFVTTCNPDANYTNGTELCNNYIDQYGADVTLTAPLEWFDNVCNPETFIIQFDADMLFYNDTEFNNELGIDDQYALGDRAYVEININTPPDSTFDLIEMNLQNVWVCTTNPDNEPLGLDNNLGTGGCLSSGSIIDPGFPWHLVVNGEENDLTAGGDVIIWETVNGTIRFSFVIDSSISRVNLYIQAQVTLDLIDTNSTAPTRRRMRELLQIDTTNNASQTRHFEGSTGINTDAVRIVEEVENDEDLDTIMDDIDGNGDDNVPDVFPTEYIYYSLGGLIMIIFTVFICCGAGCYYNQKKKTSQNVLNVVKMMQHSKTIMEVENAMKSNQQQRGRINTMSYSNNTVGTASSNGTPNVNDADIEIVTSFPNTTTANIEPIR